MNERDFFGLQQRRRFLQQSAYGIGVMALAHLLDREGLTAAASPAADPLTPKSAHFSGKAKSVIFLFMAGGPSHLDLFDPKPILQKQNGKPVPASFLKSLTDPIIKGNAVVMASPRIFTKHGRCGMEFCDFLPHLATCADDLCMVRSLHTHTSNHDPGQLLLNCGSTLAGLPSMGSWVTYGLGSGSRDLPGYVVLLSSSWEKLDGGSVLWNNGFLPATFRGVTLRGQGDPILHLSNPNGVNAAMQRSRLDAIADLNHLRQEQTGDREIAARIAAYELAYRMQAAAPELIDLSKESAATRALYGIDNDTTRMFGTNCLLARRLVERGVRFVQLFHSGWDDHSNLTKRIKKNAAMTDQPAAALIKDLKQRGLLDQTLVIWAGEFGRAPMYEARRMPGMDADKAGRDHHPFGFTVLLAGGGIKGGQVVGKTDELGYHAIEDRIHVHDLQATILHCLGLDHTRLTYRHQGRDFRLTDVAGQLVPKLLA
jgi:hypothetical protein